MLTGRAKRYALFSAILAPIWVWTGINLISPTTWPGNSFDRWSLGMVFLIPMMIVWTIAALVGHALGKAHVR